MSAYPPRRGRFGRARRRRPGGPVGVAEQGDHRLYQHRAGHDVVGDQQPTAGSHHRLGVEPLLAVADRQRHEHRGQPDRGDLGNGRRPGAADREISGGVGGRHVVDVRHGDVPRVRADLHAGGAQVSGHEVVMGDPGRMQHLHAGSAQVARGRDHGVVEPARAL